MKKFPQHIPGIALLAAALAPSAPALAGSASVQFNSTATVLSACSVSATDLSFGSYSASSATPLTASNTLSITCTNALPYTIALDGGTTALNVAARTMTDGSSHYLSYFLYTTSGYSTLWGDGTTGTSTLGGTGSGVAQPVSVYGRIPAAQFLNAGSYSDKVTVTINY